MRECLRYAVGLPIRALPVSHLDVASAALRPIAANESAGMSGQTGASRSAISAISACIRGLSFDVSVLSDLELSLDGCGELGMPRCACRPRAACTRGGEKFGAIATSR